MSLGQQLQQSQQRAETDRLAELARATAEKSAAEQAALREVQAFFAHAKSQFTEQICAGDPKPKPIKLSYRKWPAVAAALSIYSWNEKEHGITKASSRYNPVWEAFRDWCTAEDLQPTWEYQHDGVGIESWWVLRVQPEVA